MNGQNYTLAPLSPIEVYEDQIKLQKAYGALGSEDTQTKRKEAKSEKEKNKTKGLKLSVCTKRGEIIA